MRIIWALLWAGCLAVVLPVSPSDRVRTLTQEYISNGDWAQNISRFYDPNVVLNVDRSFAFGGEFKHIEGVELLTYRLKQAVQEASSEYNVIGVDEASGVALVRETMRGHMVRTGKEFNMTVLHVLEWNQITGKILTHVVIDENPGQTYAEYRTDAEKYFEKMLWTLYRSSYEDLSNMHGQLWNLISDDIQVKVHSYPEDLFPKEWRGKPEVLKGFKQMRTLTAYNKLKEHSERLEAKILLGTNTDVWVQWGFKISDDKRIILSVVHYIFGTDGKLVFEEIMPRPGRPWHLYSFPSPNTDKVKKTSGRSLTETETPVKFEDLEFLPARAFVGEEFYDEDYFAQEERLPGNLWVEHGEFGPLRTVRRPHNIDVLGDVKVNIVRFGQVDEVKFIGNMDDTKVRPLLAKPKEAKKVDDKEQAEEIEAEKVKPIHEQEQVKEEGKKEEMPH